jgi:O-antigen/teichoic acid export membrane protein
LTKKNIRLEYSGLIIFAAYVISIVTGLIFMFILSRALVKTYTVDGTTHSEYDLWFNINDVVPYFLLMSSVLPFWIMRSVARGKGEGLKTGIVANLIISAVAALVYIIFVPFITSSLGVSTAYLLVYFLMAIEILEYYSITALEAYFQARVPQTVGYGMLVQQVCKVVLGYIIIIRLDLTLLGAAVATLAGFGVQIVYYLRLLAVELKERIAWGQVREWLKGSVATIYNVVGNQIAAFIYLMLFQYGGNNGRGIVGAAAAVTAVITYSWYLAYALYPRLLAEKRSEDITRSLRMVLMFAIPMTIGAIALSNSYIVLLGPDYSAAWPVLIVLALDAFIMSVSSVYGSVLYAFETVDESAKLSLRRLVKSRLWMAFSLPYLHSAITLPTAYYVLTRYAYKQPYYAALYVSIINSSGHFIMFLIQYAIVRKMTRITVSWRSIAKYTLAAAVMGTLLYLIPHTTRLSMTLVMTVLGAIIYFPLLMAIDKEARSLPRSVMNEIRRRTGKTETE